MYICFQSQLEKLDPRGRTPLMLAITLGDIESTRLLILGGANVNVKNDEGWTGKIKYVHIFSIYYIKPFICL